MHGWRVVCMGGLCLADVYLPCRAYVYLAWRGVCLASVWHTSVYACMYGWRLFRVETCGKPAYVQAGSPIYCHIVSRTSAKAAQTSAGFLALLRVC